MQIASGRLLQAYGVTPEVAVQSVQVAQVRPGVVEAPVGGVAPADDLQVFAEPGESMRLSDQEIDQEPALRVGEEHLVLASGALHTAVVRQELGDRDPGEPPTLSAGQVL